MHASVAGQRYTLCGSNREQRSGGLGLVFEIGSQRRGHQLARRLCAAIGRLQNAAEAYYDFVAELRDLGPADSDDIPF
jgi:hypothetical protein